MKKKIVNISLLIIAALSFSLTSCQKEVLEAPQEENTETLIYIRAVDKDSSFTTSEQILLR